jgi:hypothetical protein
MRHAMPAPAAGQRPLVLWRGCPRCPPGPAALPPPLLLPKLVVSGVPMLQLVPRARPCAGGRRHTAASAPPRGATASWHLQPWPQQPRAVHMQQEAGSAAATHRRRPRCCRPPRPRPPPGRPARWQRRPARRAAGRRGACARGRPPRSSTPRDCSCGRAGAGTVVAASAGQALRQQAGTMYPAPAQESRRPAPQAAPGHSRPRAGCGGEATHAAWWSAAPSVHVSNACSASWYCPSLTNASPMLRSSLPRSSCGRCRARGLSPCC